MTNEDERLMLADYERLVRESFIVEDEDNDRAIYLLTGLPSEVGEFLGLYAKAIRDGVDDDDEFNGKVVKELGDIVWFVTALTLEMGLTLDEVITINHNKILDRMNRGVIQGSGDDR